MNYRQSVARGQLAVWLVSASLTLLSVAAMAATTPGAAGGSGKLSIEGAGRACFDTRSKKISLVCGTPVVHYKIATLMGDPLGNYGLTWQIDTLHIAAASGHQVKEGTAHRYQSNVIPRALWDAAQKIELSFYGAALVAGATPTVALQFNTGASVRPGGELSLNVPDGYNWDKFLVYPRSGTGLQWACSEQAPRYVEPADAKNLMRKGLELRGLQVCPRTSLDVTPVERAIEAFCSSNLKHPALFCAKDRADVAANAAGSGDRDAQTDPFASLAQPAGRTGERKTDLNDPFASLERSPTASGSPSQNMEGAFAKAEAERVATIERKRKLEAANASCQRDMAVQESCAEGSCEAEPAKEACVRSESAGTGDSCPPGKSCYIIRSYRCAEYGPNPAHAKWQACVRDAATTCAAQGKKIVSLSACINERS